jgi:hypothetical protein
VNRLSQALWRACAELGLRADLGFVLSLPDGRPIHTVARIADLGAPNGMLILGSDYAPSALKYSEALLEIGYGYSVLEEPSAAAAFDLDSFKELFCDWGWSGPFDKKPSWM